MYIPDTFLSFQSPPEYVRGGGRLRGFLRGGEVNWKVRDEEGIWDVRGEGG